MYSPGNGDTNRQDSVTNSSTASDVVQRSNPFGKAMRPDVTPINTSGDSPTDSGSGNRLKVDVMAETSPPDA
jgi:hypothetical protein